MAAAKDNTHAGYYFGHPTNYDAQKPPAAKDAVDEKVNAPPPVLDVPGYYRGRVNPAASDNQQSADDPAHHNAEPGFLAKCLMCFSAGGGRNAR